MRRRKLKIGMMVSGLFTTPPPKGLIQAPISIAKNIAEGIAKKGHDVYFFAPQGSKLKATKVISGKLKPLKGKPGKENPILHSPFVQETEKGKIFNLWDQYLISLMYKEAIKKKLDVLHIHPIDRALPFGFAFEKIPVLYTLHDPIYKWRAHIFKMFSSKNQYLVAVSNSQRKKAKELNWIGTIYNGINLKNFPFSPQSKSQLIFSGRLMAKKGVAEAVHATLKAKERLIIVGAPNYGAYWEKKIKPYLGDNIRYEGNIPRDKIYQYYQKSKALIAPLQWEEPFGLVMAEAQACGTPVIAFDRGSAREIIKDGKTGFVVPSLDKNGRKNIKGLVEAIKKISKIKRKDCREWIEEKFTLKRMVNEYEKVYYKIIKR
ncbi:glycosyltransferase [bacterium]|nr:glycosyltransferase [bacterium]